MDSFARTLANLWFLLTFFALSLQSWELFIGSATFILTEERELYIPFILFLQKQNREENFISRDDCNNNFPNNFFNSFVRNNNPLLLRTSYLELKFELENINNEGIEIKFLLIVRRSSSFGKEKIKQTNFASKRTLIHKWNRGWSRLPFEMSANGLWSKCHVCVE